jgi:hypothetical protein
VTPVPSELIFAVPFAFKVACRHTITKELCPAPTDEKPPVALDDIPYKYEQEHRPDAIAKQELTLLHLPPVITEYKPLFVFLKPPINPEKLALDVLHCPPPINE